MTLFYKDEADVETSEENPDVVNINEICQHCGNSSGYTLVGKVGGIDESEAENFEGEEVAPEGVEGENELNLDFPEEGAEGAEEPADESSEEGGEEEFNLDDLDLNLDEEEPAEEEEANESLHNSKLIRKIGEKNKLKTDIESEHLTLVEELEDLTEGADIKDPSVSKILARLKKIADATGTKIGADNMSGQAELIKKHCSEKECNMLRNVELTDGSVVNMLEEDLADWYRKKFDKPASTETQQAWEDELNGEFGEISDKRRKHLERKFAQQRDWEARHESETDSEAIPVEEPAMIESMHNSELLDKIEDKNELKTDIESEHLTLNEETDIEECDKNATDEPLAEAVKGAEVPTAAKQESFKDVEDFDEESFNEHLTKYMTEVYSNVNKFTATSCGLKANKLVVEGLIEFKSGKTKKTTFIFESSGRSFKGFNSDFSAGRAFNLKASIKNKKFVTEGFAYRYKIGESLVRGSIK
jgi:hypothetical protein